MWSALHLLRFLVTRLSYLGARCSTPRLPRFTFAVAALRCAVFRLFDGFEDKTRSIFCNRPGGYTSSSRVATFRGYEGAKGPRPRQMFGRPSSVARTVAWVRSETPSLAIMRRMWALIFEDSSAYVRSVTSLDTATRAVLPP